MTTNEALTTVESRTAVWWRTVERARPYARLLDSDRLVTLRYLLVAGLVGVPLSIAQLTVMLYLYSRTVGDYGPIALNAMWLLNFELGLLRNFAAHCWYTWRMRPTWRRLQHAHVAAVGALLMDLVAFNTVVAVTGIVPLAQLIGAGSGFGFNFVYNTLKTFAGAKHAVVEQVTP